jgi:hypothetical protein
MAVIPLEKSNAVPSQIALKPVLDLTLAPHHECTLPPPSKKKSQSTVQ